MKGSTFKVDYLARVEGECAVTVTMKGQHVSDVKLNVFEPPRFFEAFLRGRRFDELPDITARICGICPVAYQMSACQAVEDAFGVAVSEPIRSLRRLLYCGEWIESHALHVYLLHAPDFLGYEDAIRMAKDHPDEVKRGLRLKKIGNAIVNLVGGREIHPINVRVGGFYKLPDKAAFLPLVEELKWALDASLETARWVSKFALPDFERDYEFVALRHDSEYPITHGRLISSRGLDIAIRDFEQHFAEEHLSHSNALQSSMRDVGPYFVGPMARYSLNFDHLTPLARETAHEAGIGPECRNPFQSIIVRSIELVYACEEALRLAGGYEKPDHAAETVTPKASSGHGCSEAPRGILYHRYRFDDRGTIVDAKIVPPTSQNQKTIERDLWEFVSANTGMQKDRLQWRCEQAVRNYDPCISCATHFVKLHIEHQ